MEIKIIHPETDRLLRIRVSPSTTVANVTDAIVKRLRLARFDARRLRQLSYSLVSVPEAEDEDEDEGKELVPEQDVQSQINEGATLKLRSTGSESSVLSSEHALATFKLSATWSVRELEQLLHSLRESYIALYS